MEKRKDWRIRELQLKVRQIDRGIEKAQAKRTRVAVELQRLLVLRELRAQQARLARAPMIAIQDRPSTAVIQQRRDDETDQLIADLMSRGYQRRHA
jgi:hypothetical protein